jgi:two-component system response regulator HydG
VVTGLTPEEAGHELIYRALMQLGGEIKMLRELILDNLPHQTEFEAEPETELKEGLQQIPRGTLKDMEKTMIEMVLKETGGNRKETARRLDIGERTLYRKLKEYNLS